MASSYALDAEESSTALVKSSFSKVPGHVLVTSAPVHALQVVSASLSFLSSERHLDGKWISIVTQLISLHFDTQHYVTLCNIW